MKEVEGTEANCTTFDQLILSIEAKVQTIKAGRIRLLARPLSIPSPSSSSPWCSADSTKRAYVVELLEHACCTLPVKLQLLALAISTREQMALGLYRAGFQVFQADPRPALEARPKA